MPMAPTTLFQRVGLSVSGTVPWGSLPNTQAAGVYAVSLCSDPACNDGLIPEAPIDVQRVQAWIARVPTFEFRGQCGVGAQTVSDFLKLFWLSDESIVYIGKATCLHQRLGQYRGHKLGNRSPHAGGHWIKTLSNLDNLFIHFCACSTEEVAKAKEDALLGLFRDQVSPHHRVRLRNPIPFANRAHPDRNSKQADIRNDVLP